MAKKRQKKNRRNEDSTVKYIVFATAILNLVHAVLKIIEHFTG